MPRSERKAQARNASPPIPIPAERPHERKSVAFARAIASLRVAKLRNSQAAPLDLVLSLSKGAPERTNVPACWIILRQAQDEVLVMATPLIGHLGSYKVAGTGA